MLERELTYRMPFERMLKLGRAMSRKVYARWWYSVFVIPALFILGVILLVVFDRAIQSLQAELGLPWFTAFALLTALYVGSYWLVRRQGLGQMKTRADYDQEVRFREQADGLRFATDDIEYLLKWRGITQLLSEPDGIVVSQGNLFFLVPDTAFASREERNALVRDVYPRLTDRARELSEPYVRAILGPASPARTDS